MRELKDNKYVRACVCVCVCAPKGGGSRKRGATGQLREGEWEARRR